MEQYIDDLYKKIVINNNTNTTDNDISNVYINILYLLKNIDISEYNTHTFKYYTFLTQINNNFKIILNTIKSKYKNVYIYIDGIYPKIFIDKFRLSNYNNKSITLMNDNILILNIVNYLKILYPNIEIFNCKSIADKEILNTIYNNYNHLETYYILTTSIDILLNALLIKYDINIIYNNKKYNNIIFAKNIIEYIKQNTPYIYIDKFKYANIIKNIIFIISLIDSRYINTLNIFNINSNQNILGIFINEYCNILNIYNMNIIENNSINVKILIKLLDNINIVFKHNNSNSSILNRNYICENYFKSIVWFYKYYININIYNFNWNFINNKISQLNITDFINYLKIGNKNFLSINNMFISPIHNINILNTIVFFICTNRKDIILKEFRDNNIYKKYYNDIKEYISIYSKYFNNNNIIYIEPETIKKYLKI